MLARGGAARMAEAEATALDDMLTLATSTGDAFSEALLRALTKRFNVAFALVGELDASRAMVVARVVLRGGARATPVEYALEDTPCRDVMHGEICIHPSAVASLFPRDMMLVDLSIEAYAGLPLRDVDGATAGLVVLLWDRPIDGPTAREVEETLRAFAARASGELRRARAEDAVRHLESSEARLKALAAAIPDLVLVVSSDFRFLATFTDQPDLYAAGYDGRAGTGIAGVLPVELAASVAPGLSRLFERESLFETFEYDLETPRGRRTFEARARLLAGGFDGEPAVVVTVRDETEARRAVRDLAASEARFHASFEQAAVGMVEIDVAFRIARANGRATAMLGREAGALVGTELASHVDPMEREGALRFLERVSRHGSAAPRELPILRPDEVVVHARVTASRVTGPDGHSHLLAVLEDVTDRKAMELRLKLTLAALDGLLLPMFWLDARGRFIYANAAAGAFTGVGVDELLGRAASTFVATADFPKPGEGLDGPGVASLELEVVLADGARQPVQLLVSRAVYANEPVWVVIVSDQRERRRAEESLGVVQRQLAQAQKLEAVGRLAGGVAHDFNNLLSVILGVANLLVDSFHEDDERRDDVLEIARAATRGAQLTRQLLVFSRQQVVELRPLLLADELHEVHRLVRRVIGEDVMVTLAASPDAWPVNADRSQLEQVLLNLAVNARDAMPRGGVLSFRVLNEPDARPPASWMTRGDHVVLEVADTGCGMDAATVERIFDPFFTTKEPGKGTGLGLSTAYASVRQWGCAISVDSTPGQGTTFRLWFPRASEAPTPVPRLPPADDAQGGHETVLLVEDEAPVRSLLRRILRGAGYDVLTAGDATQALDVAERYRGTIDLLVADVVLPNGSGPEIADALTRRRPGLRVGFVSGYTDRAITPEVLTSLDAQLLQKPFEQAQFLRFVRERLTRPGARGEASPAR